MLKMKKKNFIIALLIVFLLGGGVATGGLYLYYGVVKDAVVVDKTSYYGARDFVAEYSDLYQLDYYISQNYLWNFDKSAMKETMYKDMVNSLGDEYSEYMNKEEFKKWSTDLSGEFSGVGLVYTQVDNKYVVVSIIKNSPASENGFKAGDILLKVDGKAYDTMDKLQKAMRGEEGTTVSVTYERDGKEYTKEIIRRNVTVPSVESQVLEGNVGYIRINAFDKATGEEFNTELKEMENKSVRGLVIDLRQNGGGYVSESIKVADALLPSCNVTSMKDKNGVKQEYNSEASCTNLKYVFLVDGGTASASEILAGAIQDNEGGKIVGTKTYGKGIVQTTYTLADETGLKLTTMEYVTPNGNKVHKKGITPDYVVELKSGSTTDYQLNKALELLK